MRTLAAMLVVVALPGVTQAAPIFSGTSTRLVADPANQTSPAIHGSRVVWTDSRNTDLDVWALELGGGLDQAISEDGGPRAADYLSDIGVRWAVWTRAAGLAGGGADVWAYDFTTGLRRPVAATGAAEMDPAVSADKVAYVAVDPLTSLGTIRVADLGANSDRLVAGDATHEALSPAISGSLVAYVITDGVAFTVEVADVSGVVPVVVFREAGLPSTGEPDLDGTRVAYLVPDAIDPAQFDLRVHDVATNVTHTLRRPGDQGWPRIAGDFVAFEEAGGIALAHEPSLEDPAMVPFPVPSAGVSQLQLHDLSGSMLVFQARAAAGDFDVWSFAFTATTPPPPPPPPPPPGPVVDCASADAAGLQPIVDRIVRRRLGRPTTISQGFTATAGKTALVCLDNGPGGAQRVTDGRVWLNGDRVPAQGHLGLADAHLEDSLTLERQNRLVARASGRPKGEFRVRIFVLEAAPGGDDDDDDDDEDHHDDDDAGGGPGR